MIEEIKPHFVKRYCNTTWVGGFEHEISCVQTYIGLAEFMLVLNRTFKTIFF